MELFAFDQFFWGALLIGFVASLLVMAQVQARNRKRLRKKREKDAADAAAVGLLCLEPKQRYEMWRAELMVWAKDNGSREGLEAWIERWRDIPHEKPVEKKSEPIMPKGVLRAGVDAAVKDCEVTVLDVVTSENGVAKHRRVEFTAPEPITSDRVKEAVEKVLRDIGWPMTELMKTTSDGPRALTAPKFRIGQWVRCKTQEEMFNGRLMRIREYGQDGFFLCEYEPDCTAMVYVDALDVALPRKGEWWTCSEPCCDHPAPWQSKVDTMFPTPHHIVPVNFGRGEEGKG